MLANLAWLLEHIIQQHGAHHQILELTYASTVRDWLFGLCKNPLRKAGFIAQMLTSMPLMMAIRCFSMMASVSSFSPSHSMLHTSLRSKPATGVNVPASGKSMKRIVLYLPTMATREPVQFRAIIFGMGMLDL